MFSLSMAMYVAVFGIVATVAYLLLMLCDPYWSRVRRRIGAVEEAHAIAGGSSSSGAESSPLPTPLLQWIQRLAPSYSTSRPQLLQRLAKAGIYQPSAVSRYFVAQIVSIAALATLGLLAGLAGYLRADMAVLGMLAMGLLGSLIPSYWLARAIARHNQMLQKSLPDFLDLMTVCLEGGMSLQETIRRVGDELRLVHPAFASELAIVQRDTELGATVDQALKRFARRSDCEGIKTLSTFIREAQRFGTNIAEALRSHADVLRTQREQVAEEKAQKASVKILLPTMLLIFPATFIVIVGPAAIQIFEAFGAK